MNNTLTQLSTCYSCGKLTSKVSHRISMPGNYCPTCAMVNKCGSCGQYMAEGEFKADVQNWICTCCNEDYKEVVKYIKPIAA